LQALFTVLATFTANEITNQTRSEYHTIQILDKTQHGARKANVIHHYRGAQITVGIQDHASAVLGFDATFTTLTEHSKITAYIIYLKKKRFLLSLIVFWSHEQKV